MDMRPSDFVVRVIRPALTTIALDGPGAEQLLLGTALQETGLRNIRQIGGGPALGYFQIEPATHDDIWKNFLKYRVLLAAKVKRLLPAGSDAVPEQLIQCPQYAAAIARIIYLRAPGALPAPEDVDAQAAYYKQYYNTAQGAATAAQYVSNWSRAMMA